MLRATRGRQPTTGRLVGGSSNPTLPGDPDSREVRQGTRHQVVSSLASLFPALSRPDDPAPRE